MRNYLQDLLGETTLENDHEFRGDFQSPADTPVLEVVDAGDEKQLLTEVAIDQVTEDSTTLESLIESMKAAIKQNGSLTNEGAAFASFHIQSIGKRYGVAQSDVTTESFKVDASRLTLEAAEAANESLWQRFKQMIKVFFTGILNFIKKILGVSKVKTAELKKVALATEAKLKEGGVYERKTVISKGSYAPRFNHLYEAQQDKIVLGDSILMYIKRIKEVDTILAAYDKSIVNAITEYERAVAGQDDNAFDSSYVKILNNELSKSSALKPQKVFLASTYVEVLDEGHGQIRVYAENDGAKPDGELEVTVKRSCIQAGTQLCSIVDTYIQKFQKAILHDVDRFEKMIKHADKGVEERPHVRIAFSNLGIRTYREVVTDMAGFLTLTKVIFMLTNDK